MLAGVKGGSSACMSATLWHYLPWNKRLLHYSWLQRDCCDPNNGGRKIKTGQSNESCDTVHLENPRSGSRIYLFRCYKYDGLHAHIHFYHQPIVCVCVHLMPFINLVCETSKKPLSSVPNCPCNTAWYCYCPFTLAHLRGDCAICFKCASLGPGTKLCGWQWLCLIVLGTASLATWVIQSACSCPPATVKSSSFRSFLHSQNGNVGFSRLDLNGYMFSCIQLKKEKKKKSFCKGSLLVWLLGNYQ